MYSTNQQSDGNSMDYRSSIPSKSREFYCHRHVQTGCGFHSVCTRKDIESFLRSIRNVKLTHTTHSITEIIIAWFTSNSPNALVALCVSAGAVHREFYLFITHCLIRLRAEDPYYK